MKIYTLWRWDEKDPNTAPWIVGAIDEYCVYENNGYPDDYEKERTTKSVREIVIEVPEKTIRDLWSVPTVQGKTEK
jgi:hypothetical protein